MTMLGKVPTLLVKDLRQPMCVLVCLQVAWVRSLENEPNLTVSLTFDGKICNMNR